LKTDVSRGEELLKRKTANGGRSVDAELQMVGGIEQKKSSAGSEASGPKGGEFWKNSKSRRDPEEKPPLSKKKSRKRVREAMRTAYGTG